jgi:hypothetical protein
MLSFSDMLLRDEFLLLFLNLHFAHTESQGKLKKENLIESVLDIIRSNYVTHFSPIVTVAVDENTFSFKT